VITTKPQPLTRASDARAQSGGSRYLQVRGAGRGHQTIVRAELGSARGARCAPADPRLWFAIGPE